MAAASRLVVRAPAKVNLGLRITGRRPDGYHELDSLFAPLDWADELTLVLAEPGAGPAVDLECRDARPDRRDPVPPGPDNLAFRAAEAYLRRAGARARLQIQLQKRLPAAAGLGGGSSDAGAVLRGLDQLLGGAVPPAELRDLALSLGADVPFFLDPRPARVSGIGECVEPVGDLPQLFLLLANPGESLATAAVYAAYDEAPGALTPIRAGSTMRALSGLRAACASAGASPRAPSSRPRDATGAADSSVDSSTRSFVDGALVEALESLLVNDLEPAARRLCPRVVDLQERMRALGALATGMSGSGATVFGVFPDERSAGRARQGMRDESAETGARAGSEDPTEAGWARVARLIPGVDSAGVSEAGASPNW